MPARQTVCLGILFSLSLSPNSCCYSSGQKLHLFVCCPNRDYESVVRGTEKREGTVTVRAEELKQVKRVMTSQGEVLEKGSGRGR